jgi:hypothetical protein
MTWVLALILLPLVGAVVLCGLRKNDRTAMAVALAFSIVEFLLMIPMWATYHPNGDRLQQTTSMDWIPTFGIHIAFGIDGIALIMIAVITFLVPIVIGALGTADKLPEGRSAGGYLALILVQQALTIAVFAATDVFLFYVLFEIMLVPMYFLIGGYGGANRQYAAVKFFLYSFLGGLIMLASAIGAYSIASDKLGKGTFDWATLVTVVRDAPTGTQIWLFLGFFLAFAIKAPLVPFHTWLPDAAGEAPIGVAVLIVGVLDKVGTFGFLRYCLPMFPEASKTLAPLVLILAVIGVLYGSILAAGQQDPGARAGRDRRALRLDPGRRAAGHETLRRLRVHRPLRFHRAGDLRLHQPGDGGLGDLHAQPQPRDRNADRRARAGDRPRRVYPDLRLRRDVQGDPAAGRHAADRGSVHFVPAGDELVRQRVPGAAGFLRNPAGVRDPRHGRHGAGRGLRAVALPAADERAGAW